jgi:hypothetical protein
VRAWVDRSVAWVTDAARRDEPRAATSARLAVALRDAIAADAASRGLALTTEDWRVLATDIDLNAQGLAVAADRARGAH